MTLVQKHHVVVREIRKDRSAVKWWLKHRHQIRSLQPSAPFVFCKAIGIMAPGDVCVKAQHMVKAIHVLHKIEAKLEPKARTAPVAEPGWWLTQAACIRSREGAWTSNTGNGYYGAYQFLLSTWQSVGGQGYPYDASPAEQTFRAWLVWQRDGGSWREWSTAGACGLS